MTSLLPSTSSLSPMNSDICAICLNEIQSDSQNISLHSADKVPHIFHRKCFKDWQNEQLSVQIKNASCPICRRSVTPILFSASSSRPSSQESRRVRLNTPDDLSRYELRPRIIYTRNEYGSQTFTTEWVYVPIQQEPEQNGAL